LSFRNRTAAQVLCAASLFVAMLGAGNRPQPATVSVCVDRASPSQELDLRVARAAFAATGNAVRVVTYDGTYGIVDRYFRFLANKRCALILGMPVETSNPDAPRGLEPTAAYAVTGYVFVTLGRKAPPKGAPVAVEMAAPPSFYLAGALGASPGYAMDFYSSEDEALAALFRHADSGAMVWYPSLLRYERRHAAARPASVSPLRFPHARWQLVAFYDPRSAGEQAKTFERGIAFLRQHGRLAALTGPQLPE
jgi:hypothetical protein